MTFEEAKVAIQLEAEERLGAVLRMHHDFLKAQEDAVMKRSLEALGGSR